MTSWTLKFAVHHALRCPRKEGTYCFIVFCCSLKKLLQFAALFEGCDTSLFIASKASLGVREDHCATLNLASIAFCNCGVHSNLMWPTASAGSHLFRLIHHSTEHLQALKSPKGISALHFSGASDAGTRGAGLVFSAAIAGTSAWIMLSGFIAACGLVVLPFRRPIRGVVVDLGGGMLVQWYPADCAMCDLNKTLNECDGCLLSLTPLYTDW